LKNLHLILALFFFSSFAFLHGGGLNKYGCHNDNVNGGYHCHQNRTPVSQPKPQTFPKKTSEKLLTKEWCRNNLGVSEFRTKDGTFVDCLTDVYALEAEFDDNWKEAIGQSLHYAESTDKKAAILLIKRKKSRKDYQALLERVINKYDLPITVFVTNE
tara:strand:+ start:977 stop:1450 length:474 start_codon:yes stop_codon:yes gene_type:complete